MAPPPGKRFCALIQPSPSCGVRASCVVGCSWCLLALVCLTVKMVYNLAHKDRPRVRPIPAGSSLCLRFLVFVRAFWGRLPRQGESLISSVLRSLKMSPCRCGAAHGPLQPAHLWLLSGPVLVCRIVLCTGVCSGLDFGFLEAQIGDFWINQWFY